MRGRIDWTRPMDEVRRLVRAVTRPYAGAFTDVEYRGRRVRMLIWDAVPFSYDMRVAGAVGRVVHEMRSRPLIKCRDGILLVKDFTPQPG